MAIHIEPFNRESRFGFWPHILKEGAKVQPSITDDDSATAVARIGMVVRIQASLAYLKPCSIFRSDIASIPDFASMSMFESDSASNVLSVTSAALNRSVFQMVGLNRFFSAAVAFAVPSNSPSFATSA
jgi:hypothetical protein